MATADSELLCSPSQITSSNELEFTFDDDEFDERVFTCAAEDEDLIYVVKVKAEGEDDTAQTYSYQLTMHLSYSPSHVTSLALIKRATTLDPLSPLATQLHILNLFGGDETPYESLHAVVSSGIKPWFDAFVGTRGGGKDGDSKMARGSLTKRYNVEMPETHLLIHPTIQHVVSEALATNTRPYRRWGYATGCADSGNIQQAEGDKRLKEEKFLEGNMTLKPIVHEIRIQNQVIFLDPPIEYARSTWIHQLHDWLGIMCRLRRIQSSRYEIGLQMQGAAVVETSYISLLTHFPDNALERPFSLIEIKVQHLRDYISKWLQFQSLWDLEAEYVFNRLGEDLAHS
ncbi:hypothetical protein PILCRDRAFT_4982 [Piloderma croceum F 1598]|uniref:Uncharacterized protein n=1 Tax=Piloderma croceum (strain F 1598) TaxID=765440 RepID=A0A0C3BJH3_PILCF|nr:hypothetical protein PILCRDRAFT_4982 [Piloderma croceum F 1598]